MTYKVSYSGYAFVEADSEEEARDQYNDDMAFYEEMWIDEIEEWED